MKDLTNLYKLLSDDTRLRMMLLLYKQDLCVCQISGVLQVPQPRVSKNLAKLRDLNLVADWRHEKFIYYRLKTDKAILLQTLELILSNIAMYPQIQSDLNRLADKDQYTATLGDAPPENPGGLK